MKDLHTKEQIDDMRKRLYQRGKEVEKIVRHELTDSKVDVSRNWEPKVIEISDLKPTVKTDNAVKVPEVAPGSNEENIVTDGVTVPISKKKKYRKIVLVGSIATFVVGAVAAGLFFMFGGNQVSNKNIIVSMEGPPLVGGGEIIPIQVVIANENSVPIEAGTLILRYPEGTKSVGESPKNIYEERIPLNDIAPGEIKDIPVKVAVFGETNSEKIIKASIEYRTQGSNGTFNKTIDPFVFRISSSPLVLRIDSIDKVASGQHVDMLLTISSNASTPMEDILVTASYPNGFFYKSSKPEPVQGQNVWLIEELLPEQSTTVKLEGVTTGLTDEELIIRFNAGPANSDNKFVSDSVLARTETNLLIERPFIDVEININDDLDGFVLIPQSEVAKVELEITNTLEETIYDMVVEIVPRGNALTKESIESLNGFYDSNTGSVRWEVSNNSSFEKVLSGDSRNISYNIRQGPVHTSASFDMVVNVYAKRVDESSAQETLVGSVTAEAKYSSIVSLGSQAGRNVGRFGDSGPIPPQVGEATTYTITLVAEADANDLTSAVVETSLPIHANWLDEYDAEGTISYNDVSKKIQWDIGDMSLGERKEFVFQVSINPSVSQIGELPVLINEQIIKANDRFTGALLQARASAVTTKLSEEMGFEEGNGKVVK